MQTTEYTTQDKSDWGDGPWQSEPDHIEWIDKATGLPCLINRNRMGSLCGYVGVRAGHPFYGKNNREHSEGSSKAYMRESSRVLKEYGSDFSAIPEEAWSQLQAILENNPDYDPRIDDLNVHGGVTYVDQPCELTREDWERSRKDMLACKASIEEYPQGDAAESWATMGHLVEDYDAWVKYALTHFIHHAQAPDVTWIGFDTGHSGDYLPKMEAMLRRIMPDRPGHPAGSILHKSGYKTVWYVQKECRELAKQLHDIAFKDHVKYVLDKHSETLKRLED